MAATKRLQVLDGRLDQLLIVAIGAGEARAAGFIEGNAEFDSRIRVDDGFVDVFNRLDEMGLTKDDVGVGGDLNRNVAEYHVRLYLGAGLFILSV